MQLYTSFSLNHTKGFVRQRGVYQTH